MKKAFSFLFVVVFFVGTLCGCAGEIMTVGEAKNEILTYKKLDRDKTTLVVSRTGNIYIDAFSKEFEIRNPDVQVVCLDISGGDKHICPAEDWLSNGLAPDVMFWAGGLVSDDFIKNNFINLSTNPVIEEYQAEALNNVAIDGNLYCLPCPSEVACMLYNKTLFEQYGWQIPVSFNEFVALCDRIMEDTNGEVEP